MGVFDFFRRKQAVVEPIVEQNVLVNEANEEKPVNNIVSITTMYFANEKYQRF